MNRDLLPIGSVIELDDGRRLIIINYEVRGRYGLMYLCGGYPTLCLSDLIPPSNVDEFKDKYKFYNTDTYLEFNDNFKIVFEGYKNDKFYEFRDKVKNIYESLK